MKKLKILAESTTLFPDDEHKDIFKSHIELMIKTWKVFDWPDESNRKTDSNWFNDRNF